MRAGNLAPPRSCSLLVPRLPLLAACLLLGSCRPATSATSVESVTHAPTSAGLYGHLSGFDGQTLSLHHVGVSLPEASVVLDGSPLAVSLTDGTYVAVLRSADGETVRRRLFGVAGAPVMLDGAFEDPWVGEDTAVGMLQRLQAEWHEGRQAIDSVSASRESALADAGKVANPRLRTLALLAAEAMFAERDQPPTTAVLSTLPEPGDPALGALGQFPGPVYLAMKFGDAAAKARGQTWLDAVTLENPEPGARAMALYFGLEAARLHAPDEIRERYARIPSLEVEGTSMLKIIEATFDPQRLARPGARIPEFEFERLDGGGSFRNDDLAGTLVLLHFWATWCPPCIEAIPALERVHANLRAEGRDVVFVSINCDEDPEAARRFRREQAAMRWTHLHVGSEDADAALERFGLLGPGRLLVNPAGTILATSEHLDAEHIEATLSKALAGTLP